MKIVSASLLFCTLAFGCAPLPENRQYAILNKMELIDFYKKDLYLDPNSEPAKQHVAHVLSQIKLAGKQFDNVESHRRQAHDLNDEARLAYEAILGNSNALSTGSPDALWSSLATEIASMAKDIRDDQSKDEAERTHRANELDGYADDVRNNVDGVKSTTTPSAVATIISKLSALKNVYLPDDDADTDLKALADKPTALSGLSSHYAALKNTYLEKMAEKHEDIDRALSQVLDALRAVEKEVRINILQTQEKSTKRNRLEAIAGVVAGSIDKFNKSAVALKSATREFKVNEAEQHLVLCSRACGVVVDNVEKSLKPEIELVKKCYDLKPSFKDGRAADPIKMHLDAASVSLESLKFNEAAVSLSRASGITEEASRTTSIPFGLVSSKDNKDFIVGSIKGADYATGLSDPAKAELFSKTILAENSLRNIYRSNLPYVLSDEYDTRISRKKQIKEGDPLSIIINKIYLANNGDPLGHGEIAVVVSIDDGEGSKTKHVLVSYDDMIGKQVRLPMSSLLAYYNDAYNGQPVRVQIQVYDDDTNDSAVFSSILKKGAEFGATYSPAFAATGSMAAELGQVLTQYSATNDLLAKFTFQTYPWQPGMVRNRDNQGVPRIAKGNYVVVAQGNDPPYHSDGEIPKYVGNVSTSVDRIDLQMDYDFDIFNVKDLKCEPFDGNSRYSINKVFKSGGAEKNYPLSLADWPVQGCENPARVRNLSYVVFTVDNTPLTDAMKIMQTASEANESILNIAQGASSKGAIALLNENMDGVISVTTYYAAVKEFNMAKTGKALSDLNSLRIENKLSSVEKGKLEQFILKSLNVQKADGPRVTASDLDVLLNTCFGKLIYRESAARFDLAEDCAAGGAVFVSSVLEATDSDASR